MKKILPLFVFAFWGFAAFAQPTLTQASVGALGTTYYMGVADTFPGGISEGNIGANQDWDFTGLGVNGFDTIWFQNPAGTPYAANFPAANLVVKQASLNGGLAYMESTSTHLDIVGLAGDLLGTGSPIVLPQVPPSRVAAFPATFGSTFSGVTNIDVTVDASGFGIPTVDSARYKNKQDRQLVADAWGTLRIPDGNYTNTLRIKEINNQIDSIWIRSAFFGWQLFQDSSYTDSTFTWWDETKGYYLLQLSYIGGRVNDVTYQDPIVVGKPEAALQLFTLYPNPASQYINVATSEREGELQIFDLVGKLLMKEKLSKGNNQISTEKLEAGQYIYRIQDRQNQQVQAGKISIVN